MEAQENKNTNDVSTINLLVETEKALKNHHLTWNSVKYIRNGLGLIPIADFVSAAKQIYYNNGYGEVEIDPTLKIVGGCWWLERFNYDGHEGWIYVKKPQRPTLNAVDFKLNNVYGYNQRNADWEQRIEK